ncbi:uncharacterized protein EV154DRAFT_523389 [Mucor mucedo]|uniref:uncharacterized protein n=1 Tax=Mucor mucedo TaxID=29922 RepID=UPI00221F7BB0|nr:uncharacterized protein EV154DRAFT_523389 [Mucor mucedo]KAI7881503.1 hypothetical protein EV154DRAFT_523389 [Mucor mucedo]
MLPSISNLLISPPVIQLQVTTPPTECSLPPLEGDDPPQRLRLPSCPLSPKIPFWNSPTPSCSSTSSIVSYDEAIEPKPIPNTQIVFDSTGQAVLKRRRGRPPTCNTSYETGGWTFLTPTVWDIHVSQEQKEREIKADHDTMLRLSQQVHVIDDNMNDSMNAFTDSNMDTLLQMPRKKRGRKPKTHIVGNSCFVWKDLTCTRSTIKK